MTETEQIERLENVILAWQTWWNKHGCVWYTDGNFPQEQRPPFLQSENPMYNEWLLPRQFVKDEKNDE